jgi:transposase
MTKPTSRLCERVIRMGRRGCSERRISNTLGITIRTLRMWAREYPKFGDALKLARDCEQAYWEALAVKILNEPVKGQDPSFNMRTRRKHQREAFFRGRMVIDELSRRFPQYRLDAPDVATDVIDRVMAEPFD